MNDSRFLDHPVVREAIADARREGYAEAMRASYQRTDEARRIKRKAEELLFAAADSNGGTLRIAAVSLQAVERGDYVSIEGYDPRGDEVLITAKRKA